jgi:hypothetical protein
MGYRCDASGFLYTGDASMRLRLVIGLGAMMLLCNSVAWAALANHAELLSAHQQVQAAIKSLVAAANGKKNFGDHRNNAENLLKQALTQIELASEFADKNPAK